MPYPGGAYLQVLAGVRSPEASTMPVNHHISWQPCDLLTSVGRGSTSPEIYIVVH